MASPTQLSVQDMKRLVRYLVGRPRLVHHYEWQKSAVLEVHSDTDWAGCVRTRKLTTGGCATPGKHLVKSWSSTQASISLSSGEAEMIGVTTAAAAGIGLMSLLRDLGKLPELRV